MKRYWLFAGEATYPCGGMGDFKGWFDTPEEAKAHPTSATDWAHIFDAQEAVIVATRYEDTPWKTPEDGRLEFGLVY